MSPTGRLVAWVVAGAAAFVPPLAGAQGGMPTYEPQQRLRTALDTCTKSEVMRDAYCVKKCASGFRMEISGPKARCIGLRPDATYTPPKPSYQPPANSARKAPQPGA
jgi:hypothetical protein